MENKNKAPKSINREGGDESLRKGLCDELDREMEKAPDEIDVKKVDSIITLLNHMDNVEIETDELSKEAFAEKYLSDYKILYQKNRKIKHSSMKTFKTVACIAVFIIVLGLGNYASVRATNKDIFTFIKDKAYIVCFDVFGKTARENAIKSESVITDELIDADVQNIGSWEEAKEIVGTEFRTPQYIPEGLEAQNIHIQKSDSYDIGISRQYYTNRQNLRIFIRKFEEKGKWISAMDKMEGLIEKKEINGNSVTIFQIDDAMQAIFQDEIFIYIIETNLGQNTLEKIVEGMR